ncbi:884_t:CDS:1 [Diversispora eburnea]|uniref:884_t:CDS:1 n=1 Tax=Diversispora eburnea TaxID=1213867 RepID=A0A9N9G3N2_9GLOM|nr:884_t:CDS:1 [Diversispora eburnea]
MTITQNDISAIMTYLLYENQTIIIYRVSRKVRSIDIINKLIISSCNSHGLNYNPTELRAISTRCRSNLKNYPIRFRRRYVRMANITNDYFERNPSASSYQLSNSYRIIPLRISTSDASRLQREIINLPIPRSLEEAEKMLRNRPLPTEENPIIHEKDDTPVNLFASILIEGSASAFY